MADLTLMNTFKFASAGSETGSALQLGSHALTVCRHALDELTDHKIYLATE